MTNKMLNTPDPTMPPNLTTFVETNTAITLVISPGKLTPMAKNVAPATSELIES